MIEACREGPYGARVEAIEEEAAEERALSWRRAGERFSVLPTA
jgi:acylphosphatase